MLHPLPHTANFSLFIADALYLTPSCFIPSLNPAILIYVPTTKSFHMSSNFLLLLLCFVYIEIFCSIYDWKFMFSHWNLNMFLCFYHMLPGLTCCQGSRLLTVFLVFPIAMFQILTTVNSYCLSFSFQIFESVLNQEMSHMVLSCCCLVAKSYLTLCDPVDYNISSSVFFLLFHTVYGVLVARILECLAIPSSSELHFVRTLHYNSSILGGPVQRGS